MIVYNITNEETVNYKMEQLKNIGLTSTEFNNLSDVLHSSYKSVMKENHTESDKL